MASTQITGRQIADGSIERSDINISAAGKALIRKLIVTPSTGITISSYTGADSGTGDVTLAIDTNTIATRAWVQAQGYLTSDSYVSNVQLLGNSLKFTGVGNGFGGSVDLSTIIPTESDTLATVTSRGASTSTPVTFNGNVTLGNNADLIFQDLAGVFPTTGKGFDWTLNNDGARIYAIQPSSDTIDFVFQLRDNATTNDRFVFWVQEWRGAAYDKYPLIIRGGTEFDLVDSGLFVRGTQVITNGRNLQNVSGNISMFTNDSGYITAAALNGYATQTYVNTQVANLVDSAPGTLDTLNELAAALGDDPNFATTVTNSIATKVPQTRTLTINGVSYDLSANRSWTISTADGYINDVRLIGSILEFTGVGSAFNGNIDLNQLGYLTSFTETDPTVPAHVKSITTTEKSNWNTAYSWGNHATAGYLTSYSETDTLASVTARGNSTTGSIFVNGLITGGLGAVTTAGTLDWNDVSNARSGSGYTLLLGTATNGMGGGQYYHPISFEYSSKNGGGNMTQLAIPYTGNGIWYRYRYSGSWGSWTRVWDSGDFTSNNVSNWNTAYSWGNHASAGYLTSYSETDTLDSVTDRNATTTNIIQVGGLRLGNAYLNPSGDQNHFHFQGTAIIPNSTTTANNASLGTSGYRWNNLFAGALNLSGGATISGSIALVGQLQMQNDNITGVGHIIMSDSGFGEGVEWENWILCDAPDDNSNSSGNFQIVYKGDYTKRLTLDTAGRLYTNGSQVATQTWVQSQGYLTSVSDVWVNTSGDTMTGALTIQGGWASTILDGDNVVLRKPNYSSGGWARTLLNFQEYDTTSLFQIGGYGSNNTMTYGYLGSAYNTPTFRWYANKNVVFDGNVGFGIVPSTGDKVEVAGSFRVHTGNYWDGVTIYSDGANGYIRGLGDETGLHIRSEYGNIYLADDRGVVGIGDIHASYKFNVAGAIRLTGSLVFDDTTSNTIQHRAGTDVNTLVTVGHGGFDYNGYLRISGADVATRAWVQAQGYITSDTDAQTLSYNQGAKEITISNGNSITLDNLATEDFVTSQGYLTSLPSHNHDSLYVKLDGTSIVQNTLNINSNEMGGTARSWMTRGVVIGGGGSDGAYFGMKVISANNAQTVIAWGDDSGDDLHFINTLSGGPVDGVTYMTFFGSQNTIRMYKQLDVQSTIYSQEGNSSQWSTAYSWGNHASAGYLTSLPSHNHDDRYYTESESDARYSLSRGGLGTSSDVGNTTGWANNLAAGTYTRSYIGHSGQVIVSHDTGGSVGNIAIEATYYGAMYVHVNVDSSSWNSRQIWTSENFTSTTISNWNTAYGWGNHAGLYIPLSANVNATGWVSFSASTQGTPIIKAVQQDSSSGYYLFQGVTGSSEVFRVERSGNIYMTGNLVATQSWVQSQGYITSVSDVWVNTSGDTMTGSLRFNEGSGFGRVAYLDNYHGMILRGIPSDAAGNVTVGDYTSLIQHSGDFRFYRTNGSINELYFQVNASAAYWRGNTIWHSGNDGAGSGLDADLLDGFERSATGGGDRIAQYGSNGYLYVNNWIHPANGTGLFYDSGPHFYESGGQMYSSHALRVNADILITDGTDNNRFTKGSNFLNLRDPWNNLHMQINSGGGMYFDAGHYYLRNANGGTNWLYLDGSNYNVYIEQHNYARVTFRYNTDRYAQSWYNSTTGAYWWVTTDAGQLGLHRNGDGDKFYFSNGGDFYSTTNGWLSTALAGKSNTGHTHDDRYYTESESDSRFVNVGGDSMTGTLYAPRVLLGSGTGDDYIGDGGIRIGRTDTDYTHGTSWSGTRSTMFIDCQDVATITIHDSGHRLVEYMTYSGGGTNIIYSGRDIGWGTTNWYFGADITVNGTITENSSIRYKENVKSLEYSSEAFSKLNPVRYNKKGSSVEEIGLIAEDVAALYPEVVKYDKDGNPDGVNYTRLSAILIKAVQELTDKVNQLEKNA